jgi:hypothetical protein
VVWGQNVSAQYHTINDRFLGSLPFVTWDNLTFGEYFFAGVLVAFLNGLATALCAIPFGLTIKNTYVAFCAMAGFGFLNIVLYVVGVPPVGTVPFWWNLLMLTPLSQIFNNLLWFSDGGGAMLLPHFEVLYPLIFVALLIPSVVFGAKRFTRKEIA